MSAEEIGFWLGYHFPLFVVGIAVLSVLAAKWDRWAPVIKGFFTSIGPGLAQLGARATRPPRVDTVADHATDVAFWLNALEFGSPTEQAIAPQVLKAVGYDAEVYAACATLDSMVQRIQMDGWRYIFRTFGTVTPVPVEGVRITWAQGRDSYFTATLVHSATGQTRNVRVG